MHDDPEQLEAKVRMRPAATVLHLDADAFFAAVEQRDKPSLRGKPVLVGGTGGRGVVATASYEARRAGARSAMPMSRARRLAPAAAVLTPRFDAYAAYSAVIMNVLRELTDAVEPLSIDEAFADLAGTEHAADPQRAATWAKEQIVARTGLTVSVGIGRSKLIAKIASDYRKPNGLVAISPTEEDEFLLPLDVRAIPGVGPVTASTLERIGVRTVADLRRLPLDSLTLAVGESAGANLYLLSRGLDDRPVSEPGERKSVGAERTFAQDLTGPDLILEAVETVAHEALARLARHGGGARTVVAKVRRPDFTTVTRSVTFTHPTADTDELVAAAVEATRAAGIHEPVRLLGVSFHALSSHAQLALDLTFGGAEPQTPTLDTPEPEAAPQAGPVPLSAQNARPGLDVEHPTFGRGWVIHVRGREATVRFETATTAPATSRTIDLDTDPLLLVGAVGVTPTETPTAG